MSFTAQYPGQACGDCDDPIYVGQTVEYIDDVLCHVICPEGIPSRTSKTCPTCFLVLPLTGVCDNCS